MQAYGIRGTWEKIRSANGPAQHISCSITGLIIAGMFYEMIEPAIIILWALMSVAVLVSTVWLPRLYLKLALLADFVLSMVVCFQYIMYEEHSAVMEPIYYSMTVDGMRPASSPSMAMPMTSVEEVSHVVAVVWLSLWSLYLANLVHRQILEHKRFLENDD